MPTACQRLQQALRSSRHGIKRHRGIAIPTPCQAGQNITIVGALAFFLLGTSRNHLPACVYSQLQRRRPPSACAAPEPGGRRKRAITTPDVAAEQTYIGIKMFNSTTEDKKIVVRVKYLMTSFSSVHLSTGQDVDEDGME